MQVCSAEEDTVSTVLQPERRQIRDLPELQWWHPEDELILSQIENQVRKLEDVIEIKLLKDGESVFRELIMIKVRVTAAQRGEINSIADIFRAKIVDVQEESMIIELTGTQSKLEGFMNLLKGYEILELARTGITGLSRGCEDVTYIG